MDIKMGNFVVQDQPEEVGRPMNEQKAINKWTGDLKLNVTNKGNLEMKSPLKRGAYKEWCWISECHPKNDYANMANFITNSRWEMMVEIVYQICRGATMISSGFVWSGNVLAPRNLHKEMDSLSRRLDYANCKKSKLLKELDNAKKTYEKSFIEIKKFALFLL